MDNGDSSLVTSARDGDIDAFAKLVNRYRDLVASVAFSRLGDASRSEDIAQQTFVTAWERNLDVIDPTNVVSWLCGIARNLARNEQRKSKRANQAMSSLAEVRQTSKPQPTPDQVVSDREQNEILWSIIDALPLKYREPMVLYYQLEESVTDVALALEVSEDVVRQRLHRGRKQLESRLVEFVEEGLSKRRTSDGFVSSVILLLKPPSVSSTAAAGSASLVSKLLLPLGILLSPIVGIVMGTRGTLRQSTSKQERTFIWRAVVIMVVIILTAIVVHLAASIWFTRSSLAPWIQATAWGGLSVGLTAWQQFVFRKLRAIKMEHDTDKERSQS